MATSRRATPPSARLDAGAKFSRRIFGQYPESAAGLQYLGEALVAEGRLDEARATYQKASALNPAAVWAADWPLDSGRAAEIAGLRRSHRSSRLAAAANPFEHFLSFALEA